MRTGMRQVNDNQIRQQGFTLIEVMMAMVILGIGIMSIVALQTRDAMYNNSSRRQTLAYTYAMDQVEYLRSIKIPSVNNDIAVGYHGKDISIDGVDFLYIGWNVSDNSDVDDTYVFEVKVFTIADKKKYGYSSKNDVFEKAKSVSELKFTKTESSI